VEIAQQDSQIFILDTRSDEEFTGQYQKKGAAKPGSIEGAENLDWSVAVDFEGTKKFLPADQLKEVYRSVGIDGAIPVVVYCHSGVRSAHTLFVLTELLGYRNIKNYDGSWAEWSHIR
jgi:thiosulfate/3-mercaptopyruvate sulfurtransferase